MKRALFIFLLTLAATSCHAQAVLRGQNSMGGLIAQGFTYVQDIATTCSTGTNTCITGACGSATTTCVLPTKAGSVVFAFAFQDANVTPNPGKITSVSGGSGTWNLTGGLCYSGFVNTALGSADCAYSTNVTAGTTNFTVVLAQNFGGIFAGVEIMEFQPPPGGTISFDTAGVTTSTSCTNATPCTGPALTLTATDFIACLGDTGGSITTINGWSSPYITSPLSNGINLNTQSGTAPTVTQTGTGAIIPCIAFRSSLGRFSLASPIWSIVHLTTPNTASLQACNATCIITIPSTGSGNGIFVAAATESASSVLSIVSDGTSTFTTPAGCQGTTTSPNTTTSCSYLPSSNSGKTAINITMSPGTTVAGFLVVEFHKTTGAPSVDLGPTAANNAASFTPNGINLGTLNSSSEFVIQCATGEPGPDAAQFYPITTNFQSGYAFGLATCNFLMNTPIAPQPLWPIPGSVSRPSSVFAMSFQ